MMTWKTRILLLTVLSLLAGTACRRQDFVRSGSITLTFATGLSETKALGDGNEADGGGIRDNAGVPDLVIALADGEGHIKSWYKGYNTEDAICAAYDPAVKKEATIKFLKITESGEYFVYAVANTTGLWAMDGSLEACTTIDELQRLVFSALSDLTTPSVTSDAMPLSASGTLYVSESLNGQVELDLLRCVAKVNLNFENETGTPLTLYNCSAVLHAMNPSQGYLFPHELDQAGTVRDLSLVPGKLDIGKDQTSQFPSSGPVLVFPSVAPKQATGSRYLCDIHFRIQNPGKTYSDTDETTYTAYSFTGLQVHDRKSKDIQALGRNQYLQIETRINRGNQITFNFEVVNWTAHNIDVQFH